MCKNKLAWVEKWIVIDFINMRIRLHIKAEIVSIEYFFI